MSDEIAVRDTTFDNVVPKSVWLSISNQTKPIKPFTKTDNRFQIAIEINGIGKVIGDYYIPGLDQSEGHHCESINLTWILELLKAADKPAQGLDEVREAEIEKALNKFVLGRPDLVAKDKKDWFRVGYRTALLGGAGE